MKYVSPLNAPGNCRVTEPALWDYYSYVPASKKGTRATPLGGFNAVQISAISFLSRLDYFRSANLPICLGLANTFAEISLLNLP